MQDDTRRMIALVRFSTEKFIDQLRETGKLYFNPIRNFSKIKDGSLRGDDFENLTHVYQPHGVKLEVGGKSIGKLAGPVKLYMPQDDEFNVTHIFCMSFLSDKTEIRDDLKIFSHRVTEFGDTALLIINTQIFFDRLHAAFDDELKKETIGAYRHGIVKYIDTAQYSGKMNCFKKPQNFAWQHEYRIGITSRTDQPIAIELGDLSDIAVKIPLEKFENRVEVLENSQVVLHFS